MCRSMVDIQSPTAEIRRGKKKKKEEGRTNHSMKIYMVSLLHRATINKVDSPASLHSKILLQPQLLCTVRYYYDHDYNYNKVDSPASLHSKILLQPQLQLQQSGLSGRSAQ